METTTAAKISSGAPLLKPELTQFSDYRDYLKDRLAVEKARNPNLSLNYFARKIKVSTSFLSMLLAKKKHLSLETLSAVSETLQLNETERVTLVFMVLESTSKLESQTKFFAELRLQTQGLTQIGLGMPEYDVRQLKDMYGSELMLILDALVRAEDFREDPEWIMPRLRGNRSETPEEVMAAVRKVIEARKNVGLEKNQSTLTTVPAYEDSSARVFRAGFTSFARALQDPEEMMPYIFASQSFLYSRPAYLEAFAAFSNLSKELKEIEARHPPGDRAMVFSAGLITAAKAPSSPTGNT